MLVLIDNYDSFTFNLVHYLGGLGADVTVHRNDKISVSEVLAKKPEAIVLSPGPCTPNDAGICLDLIEQAAPRVPILGVCLGHQAIGQAFGGSRGSRARAGPRQAVGNRHQGQSVFRGINGPFKATRYHSLVVERDSLPDALERHRRDRRPAGDGAVAQDLAGARRAIPSGKHRLGARPPDAEEFSRTCRAVERGARPDRVH